MNRSLKSVIGLMLSLLLICGLTACAKAEPQRDAVPNNSGTAGNPAAEEEINPGKLYENDGCRLSIPLEYDALLLTETPQNDPEGILFTVSEKASVDAAAAMGIEDYGPGWLFSIGRVDDARQKEMRCFDMVGAELFARDAEGRSYVFYHPTDVRYMREDNEAMARDQEQWSKLTAWAWNSVRDGFLQKNPELTEENYTNTLIDMFLARLAYLPGIEYTMSTAQAGPLAPEPGVFDASPWLDRLVNGAQFAWVDESETPDGEYVVLSFPNDDVRFDFFRMEGKENYVRAVWSDGEISELYRAYFADGTSKASDVVQAWYDALAAQADANAM